MRITELFQDGQFVVTAEVGPPKGIHIDGMVEEAKKYLQEDLTAEAVFYEGRVIGLELPTMLVREVVYTEPAVKGDTSGKVMKPARLATGFTLDVPAFVNTGDKIEIDTRTNEYRSRIK